MLQFYPYNIGNSWSYLWIYHNVENDYYEAGKDIFVISKDTVVNNIKYWLVKHDQRGYRQYLSYLERIDSVSGDVLRIDNLTAGEINCVDNVYASVGDTISIANNKHLLYCDKMVVLSIRDTIINNFQTTIRITAGLPSSSKLFFARNIGFLGTGKNYWLDSANVNGTVFSNITDVKDNDESIISEFNLRQNYPNPFNPTTTIEYTIPTHPISLSLVRGGTKGGVVTLKVYDILGREVTTLVNEYQQPGRYEVKFEASHSEQSRGMPSGIYFYWLQVSPSASPEHIYSFVRKMILLK